MRRGFWASGVRGLLGGAIVIVSAFWGDPVGAATISGTVSYDGSVTGTVHVVVSGTNQVLKTGTGAWMRVENSPALNPARTLTLECWINPETVDGEMMGLISKEEGAADARNRTYHLVIGGGGVLHYSETSADNGTRINIYSPPQMARVSEWTHVAAVVDRNAGAIRFYTNGVEVGVFAGATGDWPPSPFPVLVGETEETSYPAFLGKIDEVRIWNAARTPAEIRADMGRRLVGNEAGLVGYWTFDEGVPIDKSVHAHDSMLIGSAEIEVRDRTLLRNAGYSVAVSAGGSYAISNVADGVYGAVAFVDVIGGEGVASLDDPFGEYLGNPLTVTGDVAGVDIEIAGPDADGDGMLDAWEERHFGTKEACDAGTDAEPDGLTNIEEMRRGTDPTRPDTDGDGRPDGWEAQYGLDPRRSGDAIYATFPGYTRSETLTNFPALLLLNTNVPGFSYEGFASSDGWDLRITESNSVEGVPYEIEEWDTNGTSVVWVRLKHLSTNCIPLRLSWGSSENAQAPYTTNGVVWSRGFLSVHHMVGSVGLAAGDSRGRQDGVLVNCEVGDRVEGKAGRGVLLDGVDEYLDVADGYASFVGGLTVSIWARPAAVGSYQRLIDFGNAPAGDNIWCGRFGSETKLSYSTLHGGATVGAVTSPSGVLLLDDWQQFTVTHYRDGSVKMYKNAQLVASGSFALPQAVLRTNNYVGRSPYYPDDISFAGVLDELRVEVVPRSSNWVWAAWLNVASNAAFVSWSEGPPDDADGDGLSDLDEFGAGTNPIVPDTDGDGMPDGWEVDNGTDPLADDALNDKDEDGLGNLLEYKLGSRADTGDSDGDSIGDGEEYSLHGSSPADKDSDDDGIWDGWEVANGLNPTVNDAAEDRDLDGLTNLEEWELRDQGYLAGNADSDGDGKSDYENRYGRKAERYHYDRIDRLVGAEYNHGSNGLSIGYVYDGNGNILRQVYLKRDGNGDGIPDLRQFLDGVAYSNATAFADSDGDGWSDWQEWKAGSRAGDSNSVPDTMGVLGTNLATFDPGFTPSNFVMGVGQLDGVGAEEIVIGADGDPGGVTNSLLVLSQGATGWSTQHIEVGTFGVTSIAVGQIASNAPPAIYFGSRVNGGTGEVWEARRDGGNGWSCARLGISNELESAVVCGLRRNEGFAVEVSGSNSTEGVLKWVSLGSTGLIAGTVDHAVGSNSHGNVVSDNRSIIGARPVAGGVLNCYGPATHQPFVGAEEWVYRGDLDKYFSLTPTAMTWSNALAYAQNLGGTLASVTSAEENAFIQGLGGGGGADGRWIGLVRSGGSWAWLNGSPFVFQNWQSGQPDNYNGYESVAEMMLNGQWNDAWYGLLKTAVVEVASYGGVTKTEEIPLPSDGSRLVWGSGAIGIGWARNTNGSSIGFAWIDDKNGNGRADSGDEFSVKEFLTGPGWHSTATVAQVALEGVGFSESYGLAFARLFGGSNDVFFTGEPDGQMFMWRAPNSTNALARTLFSKRYSGKAWHGLAARAEADEEEGLVGLCVDPTNASVCSVLYFDPMKEAWAAPDFPQSVPMAAVMASSNSHGGNAGVDVRLWDAEGNPSAVAMQYSTNGGFSWGPASIVSLDGQAYSASAFVEAQPGGTTHAAVWDARADTGSGYQGIVLLRVQARDASGAGAWSVPVAYSMTIDVADLDLSMGDSPDPVIQGQDLAYSLTVQNGGPTEAPGAVVDVTLPGGVTFVSAVASQGTCAPAGGLVQCDLGLLANGASATITIKVRPNATGEIGASAVASHAGTDPVTGNNTASATTTVNGSDQLVVSPEVLDLGGVVFGGYGDGVFTLSNKGPSSVSGSAAVPSGVFEILSGSPYDLAGYSATEVVVRFTPSGAGNFAEDVIFESNGGTRTNRVIGVGGDLPAPDFTASPTDGAAPLAVLFTDITGASVTNRVWEFGDGGALATTDSNTVYTYTLPGTNTVTLTVQGPVGSSSATKSNLIVVVMYPPGDVNGDGRVTGADSLLINQALVPPGLRQTNDAIFAKAGFRNGDVNQDGQVTGADSLRINQVMVQLRSFVVTRMMPAWRTNSSPTAVAVYGIGFPTQSVSGVTIGPPVSLSLSNVTAVSREEIRGVVPVGGGTGTGTVSVIAFPSNSVISTGTFENR